MPALFKIQTLFPGCLEEMIFIWHLQSSTFTMQLQGCCPAHIWSEASWCHVAVFFCHWYGRNSFCLTFISPRQLYFRICFNSAIDQSKWTPDPTTFATLPTRRFEQKRFISTVPLASCCCIVKIRKVEVEVEVSSPLNLHEVSTETCLSSHTLYMNCVCQDAAASTQGYFRPQTSSFCLCTPSSHDITEPLNQ